MSVKQLTIDLVGYDSEDSVMLKDFLKQLDAIRDSLRRLEELLTDEPASRIAYKIVGLKMNSPAQIILQAEANNDLAVFVIDKFTETLNDVLRGESSDIPFQILDSIKKISPRSSSIAEVKISTEDGGSVELDKNLYMQVNKLTGKKISSFGSVRGKLDLVSVRRNKEFRIYPEIGPKWVTCLFEDRLFERVKTGIGKFVEVYGEITYIGQENLQPYTVDVENFEVLEFDVHAPSWLNIHGLENLLGDLTSEQLVSRGRNEW